MGNSADRAWQLSQLVEGVLTAFNPSHGSLSCVQAGRCVSKQIGRHDAACQGAHGAFLARPSWGPRKAGWLCGERRSSVVIELSCLHGSERYQSDLFVDLEHYMTFFSSTTDEEDLLKTMKKIGDELKGIKQILSAQSANEEDSE